MLVTKIGKPSVLQAVLIVVILLISSPFIAFGVIKYVKFSFDYDAVHAHRVFDFGANRAGKVQVYAEGTAHNTLFVLPFHITGPYRMMICTSNATQQDLTLKMARLARVVEGQLVPVDAEFNIDRKWTVLNPGVDRDCIIDVLILDVEIESREIYCVDLTFDLAEEEQVERSCLRFSRRAGTSKETILEILGGI